MQTSNKRKGPGRRRNKAKGGRAVFIKLGAARTHEKCGLENVVFFVFRRTKKDSYRVLVANLENSDVVKRWEQQGWINRSKLVY